MFFLFSLLYKLDAKEEKYDVYKDESERYKTFQAWPTSFIKPEKLSHAGFVYLGKEDEVFCPFCAVTVNMWEEGDCPETVHRDQSAGCPFVKMIDQTEGGIT